MFSKSPGSGGGQGPLDRVLGPVAITPSRSSDQSHAFECDRLLRAKREQA